MTNCSFKIISLFLCLNIHALFSQNLVLNPSFEDTKLCTDMISSFDHFVKHWSTPTSGSTDLFNSCSNSKVSIPNNYNGNQSPKSGDKYAGFYLYSDGNYREYIQGKLSELLEEGVSYTFSFYISLAETSDFAIKDISLLFSDAKLNTYTEKVFSSKQLKKAKIKNYTFHQFNNSQFYDDTEGWTLLSLKFIAKGNERFFSIGNFNTNSKTKKQLVSEKNRFNMAYYYIDSVSLEKAETNNQYTDIITPPETETKTIISETLEINTNYIFETVKFNHNSSLLSNDATLEIKSVYDVLRNNDKLSIIISGHTDTIGSSSFNKTLSEQRAKSVVEHFKSLGLNTNRISWKGYGDSFPISTNDTEKGRHKNRRVEFKIIEH